MAQTVVHCDRLGKKFCRSLKRSMVYGLTDIMSEYVGRFPRTDLLRPGEFWALDDVNLEIEQGESVGILGSNGSGKTTLLKLLSGIFMPDAGKITINGRTGALIDVGAGFHPVLTGRENVYMNGMILGMSEREVRSRFDEIVEFAGVGEFIDMPLKNYSSGMFVRLGFAVAIHAQVDVLLVDEVLAVGDLAFVTKCMRKICEFQRNGGSIILVTHQIKNVKFCCNRAMWIERGVVQQTGGALEVANAYEKYMSGQSGTGAEVLVHDDRVEILKFDYPTTLRAGERLVIDVDLVFHRPVEHPIFLLHVFSGTDESLVLSHHSDLENSTWDKLEGRLRLRMTTEPLQLRKGLYPISFAISEERMNNELIGYHRSFPLQIENDREFYGNVDGRVRFEVESAVGTSSVR